MKNPSRRDVLESLSMLALPGTAGTASMGCLAQIAGAGAPHWRTPQALVKIGFGRSRVVMMNEAHSYPKRCIRTREVGTSILSTAHEAGVRYLAMEALYPHEVAETANRERRLPDPASMTGQVFLAQPEMRTFIHGALSLGWTLVPYEADLSEAGRIKDPMAQVKWRDEQQGSNLAEAVGRLNPDARILVWCGLGHLVQVAAQDYLPMGFQFAKKSGIRAFAIDQTVTVDLPGMPASRATLVDTFRSDLERYGGTAGFLTTEGVRPFLNRSDVDAFIISTRNDMQ